MIPLVMRLVIRDENSRNVNLWLPVFLVWILLLPVFVITGLVWSLMRLFTLGSPEPPAAVRFIEAAVAILWKMNGLRVDVRGPKNRFVLHF